MELNKWATRVAVVLSTPIVLSALLISLGVTFTTVSTGKIEACQLAVRMYLVLGYPLTAIIKIFAGAGGVHDADTWWTLPLLTILLIFQWMIWAQMIVLIGRLVRISFRGLFTVDMSQHVC